MKIKQKIGALALSLLSVGALVSCDAFSLSVENVNSNSTTEENGDYVYLTVILKDTEYSYQKRINILKGETLSLDEYIPQDLDGYSFMGWYYDDSFLLPCKTEFVINSNTSLYGKIKVSTPFDSPNDVGENGSSEEETKEDAMAKEALASFISAFQFTDTTSNYKLIEENGNVSKDVLNYSVENKNILGDFLNNLFKEETGTTGIWNVWYNNKTSSKRSWDDGKYLNYYVTKDMSLEEVQNQINEALINELGLRDLTINEYKIIADGFILNVSSQDDISTFTLTKEKEIYTVSYSDNKAFVVSKPTSTIQQLPLDYTTTNTENKYNDGITTINVGIVLDNQLTERVLTKDFKNITGTSLNFDDLVSVISTNYPLDNYWLIKWEDGGGNMIDGGLDFDGGEDGSYYAVLNSKENTYSGELSYELNQSYYFQDYFTGSSEINTKKGSIGSGSVSVSLKTNGYTENPLSYSNVTSEFSLNENVLIRNFSSVSGSHTETVNMSTASSTMFMKGNWSVSGSFWGTMNYIAYEQTSMGVVASIMNEHVRIQVTMQESYTMNQVKGTNSANKFEILYGTVNIYGDDGFSIMVQERKNITKASNYDPVTGGTSEGLIQKVSTSGTLISSLKYKNSNLTHTMTVTSTTEVLDKSKTNYCAYGQHVAILGTNVSCKYAIEVKE